MVRIAGEQALAMNPYHQLVSQYAWFIQEARDYPLGTFPDPPRFPIPSGAPLVLMFSPHPDDEVIVGGLALRLMREARFEVINVAVTQGSKKERQAGRLEELRRCCDWIGFGLIQTAKNGLERITLATRDQDRVHWRNAVDRVAEILMEQKPRVIMFPHELDWNSTHVGTHYLLADALEQVGEDLRCHVVETEYWGQMAAPNLMVELGQQDLSDLITALTFHADEVRRNPYHLSLPAWMIDNVRRGAELVGGQGGVSPAFTFATLYRQRLWDGGRWSSVRDTGRYLGCAENPAVLFA